MSDSNISDDHVNETHAPPSQRAKARRRGAPYGPRAAASTQTPGRRPASPHSPHRSSVPPARRQITGSYHSATYQQRLCRLLSVGFTKSHEKNLIIWREMQCTIFLPLFLPPCLHRSTSTSKSGQSILRVQYTAVPGRRTELVLRGPRSGKRRTTTCRWSSTVSWP